MSEHDSARSLADRLFCEGLPRRGWRRLRAHLLGCPECRDYFDRVLMVSRAMGDGPVAGAVSELLLEDVLARAAPAPRRPLLFGLPLAIAACAALLLVVFMPLEAERSELVARGSPDESVLPAVRAFCVRKDLRSATAVTTSFTLGSAGAAAAATAAATCSVRDELQFAVRPVHADGTERWRWLFVVGVSESVEPLWYRPRPSEGRSIRLELAAAGDEIVIPGATRLAVNHRPGLIRIFSMFSREPMTTEQVRAAISHAAEQQQAVAHLRTLPTMPAESQRTALLRLTP